MTLGIRVVLALAFVSAAAPAVLAAQTDSSAAAPRDSASLSASALPSSPPPSATSLALADTLLIVLHSEANMAAGEKAQLDIMVRQQPSLANMRDVIAAWQAKYLTWAELGPAVAQVYARTFSEDDLRSLIAFYRTAIGQKLVAKTPDVLRQVTEIGAERAAKHQAELRSMLLSHLTPPSDTTH
jgi:hypothetical protein